VIAPDVTARIRRLFFAEHWRVGTIAAELALHHDTVRRAVALERVSGQGVAAVRPTLLDPYKDFLLATLQAHPRLTATRLFHRVHARGYPGSAIQVRRWVRTQRPPPAAEAFLRRTTLPGEEAQVDWGHFGKVRVGNTLRPLYCFVLVLGHSRALYARFFLDMALESFLRGHVLAFEALGGVPRALLYDNLKSVVLERAGDAVRFHPRLLEFAGHYHFAPRPCAPYRGNEKGKVERTIRYLRDSFFAARTFGSVEELNTQLQRWTHDVAHARRVPGEAPAAARTVHEAWQQEAPRLLPLPQHPFPTDVVRPVHSGKTPYVRFDGNDYSIPHTLVKKPLTLVASEARVRLLDGSEEVASHARSYDKGRTLEAPGHLASLAREKARAHELRGRDLLRASCAHAEGFLAALATRDVSLAHHTGQLLKLLERHGPRALDAALAEALERGALGAPSVAHLLDQRTRQRREKPPLTVLLPDDPRIHQSRVTPHNLADYDRLLADKDSPADDDATR
jgi:transposase